MWRRSLLTITLVGVLIGGALSRSTVAQSLSQQVLQLLTRANSWTATNTFLDLRLVQGVPSTTTLRFYVDGSNNLYFNGGLVAGAGGVTNPHNLLSTTHADTLAGAVARGAVVVGNSTPAWALVQPTVTGSVLQFNGTDTVFSTSGAALTSLSAANLTGTAAAINGSAITSLNASNLASGTVPLAQLSGILNAQIGAGAAIAYSKLNLTGSVLNADLAGSIAYSKLTLTGSVVTGDLTAATLLFDRWASNSCTNLQVPQYNGAAWVCKTLTPTDLTAGGTVTSVALSLPAIFTVSGSPVTTTGTLTGSLATETANTIWAGPGSGAAAAPTFRTLVVADLPTITSSQVNNTIAATGTDINTSNQVTVTHLAAALPMAQGGTGVAVAGNNTVLIGSGAAWVAQTLPNCLTGALNYATATNLFSCNTTGTTHALLSATHTDTVASTVVRGGLIVGNATPAWAQLARGSAGTFLVMNSGGTDPTWTSTTTGAVLSSSASAGVGYATGAGCAVTQGTNRTTAVVCTGTTGAITLISAAGSATPATFTVTDTSVAATDTIILNEKAGTDLYELFVTAVAAGSFKVTSFTTGGTTTEQPVISFAVLKGVAS